MAGVKWKGAIFLLGGLLLGVGLGLVVYFSGQGGPTDAQGTRSRPPTVGSTAPDFSLPVLGGNTQVLSDLQGTPVLINFWATWCTPCKEEMPLLEEVSKQHDGELVVLGVNAGENEAQITPFLQEVKISFPILLDESEAVTDLYFVRNFPITFFIDDAGVIRAMHLGTLQENQINRYLATIGINP